MRRKQPNPWEAIGMSLASWYRNGKPTEKPKRITVANEARRAGASTRTHQRIMRVMAADIDLAANGSLVPIGTERSEGQSIAQPGFEIMTAAARGRVGTRLRDRLLWRRGIDRRVSHDAVDRIPLQMGHPRRLAATMAQF
jgi:hypothetical protein